MSAQHSGGHSIIPARAFDDTAMTFKLITLLGIIGTYSNRDGYCWPSRATLAKRMGGIAVTTVSNHLARLKELGYLEVQPMAAASGAQTVNMYKMILYAPLPPERDRLKICGYEDLADMTPVQNQGGLSPESTGGLNPESTGGLSPESTGGVESRVNPERPILNVPFNDPRNETRARVNAKGASGVSFDQQKQTTETPERYRSLPTVGNTARLPEVTPLPDPTPPVAPAPPAPPRALGVERFLYWRQVRALVQGRFGPAFISNYIDRCKLYERAPGDYVLLCATPFVQEQINCRARNDIVLQLAAVACSHVELEIVC